MNSKRVPLAGDVSNSSAQALSELAAHTTELLESNSLDARFARKLLKQLAREAEAAGIDILEDATLGTSLKRLKKSVNATQAGELVAAAAELRTESGSTENEKPAGKKKQRNK
ncbi:hypothetical protein OKW50_007362 [Paraburkholderia youngii]|uniref:Uncharacterized protein n=1 Tax=Paraburkholderia youngii TaxID=2782701 RepID=A0A7W8LDM7_9BURK|nr:hypothetical protein [Paraburkholderia youngii]MBB5403719.1 hypothetical protein [Paraburkholderia youngii]NUX55369.1 hypothetical protein [Paraburkholderia youngii]NVI02482.1 hypothetical protein [Paraburkholderia youngii]